MQRKKMLLAVLTIALLVGVVSAALLTYYGRVETSVTVEQSVLLDDKDVNQMPISETVSAYGGETVCKYHWLRNRANVPVFVQLESWAYGGIPEGITVDYKVIKSWHVPAVTNDDNPYNDVEAIITKTDQRDSVEFKVEIVPDAPHYGVGIAISTGVNKIDFQVWYAEYLPDPDKGWYYDEYPWDGGVKLEVSGTGITASGDHTGKVFTVKIPLWKLGGAGAKYYFAIQFRTNLLGTFPPGLNLWAQTDASKFATATTLPTITLEPGEFLPFYICYKFNPNFVGTAIIYTDVKPAP